MKTSNSLPSTSNHNLWHHLTMVVISEAVNFVWLLGAGVVIIGGSVLFVENYKGSNPQMWKSMIERNKLVLIKVFNQSRSLSKLLRNLQSLILSLRFVMKMGNNKAQFSNPSKLIFPHYFVWSRKYL